MDGDFGAVKSDNLGSRYEQRSKDPNLSDKEREAALFFTVAEKHIQEEQAEEALKHSEEALERFRQLGDETGVADTIRIKIHVLCFKDRRKEANQIAREELARIRTQKDRSGEAKMLLSLAEVNTERRGYKNREEARVWANEALTMFRKEGNKKMEAYTLICLLNINMKRLADSCGRDAMQQAPQVSIHLQALLQLLLVQSAAFPRRDFQAAFQRLQAACLCWSGVEDSPSNSKSKSSVLGSELAAQSCESLVRALRLLNDSDLVWESKTICVAKCFLALACALRAFKTARDVLVPGQLVTICGLQSSAGSALNGLRGEVRQFHAESGRFMVSLERGDPPAEWKKLRPQNLQPDIDQSSCASLAFKGAKECGRACLEAVAEIFDDLLVQLHEEDGDELRVRLLHAQLASAMWEALLSCTDDLQMEASALLDLCSDDCTLCSMLARHLFSVHLTVRPEELDPYRIKRLLTLQESFAKAYCRLYQPSALWGPTSETAGDIRDLQANLQAHILKLANAAVQMGVLQQLIDSCDFHIDRAIAGIGPGIYPVPLVLPVLLSRLVCTLAMNGDSFVRRHVLMLVPAFLSVAESFAELVIARLEAEAANSSELLKASQAVLDATLAAIGLGLQDESRARVEALAGQFLRSAARSDAALLSRLALTLLGASQSAEWIGQSFGQLSTLQQGIFWQQTRARSHLLLCSFEDVQIALKEWCGEPSPLPPFEQPLEVPDAADTEGNEAGDCGCEALELPQDALPPLEALPVMAAAQRKALKPLGRNDIERLRGVDPADAPEDLRCAIDGKLLGVPMLSPYGHVFEQDTLKQWLATCGSVCPITGRALREEDCQVDGATQAKVRDWVKAARMSYKLKKQEKRRLRAESQNDEPTEPD